MCCLRLRFLYYSCSNSDPNETLWRFVLIPVGCCLCVSHKASWCSCKFLFKVQRASRFWNVSSLSPSNTPFALSGFAILSSKFNTSFVWTMSWVYCHDPCQMVGLRFSQGYPLESHMPWVSSSPFKSSRCQTSEWMSHETLRSYRGTDNAYSQLPPDGRFAIRMARLSNHIEICGFRIFFRLTPFGTCPSPRQMNGLRFSQVSPITSSPHYIWLFSRFSPSLVGCWFAIHTGFSILIDALLLCLGLRSSPRRSANQPCSNLMGRMASLSQSSSDVGSAKASEFQSCFDFVVTGVPKHSTHHSQGSTSEESMIISLVGFESIGCSYGLQSPDDATATIAPPSTYGSLHHPRFTSAW